MDKDTIAQDRFNAGYDEKYKAWLQDNIQCISYPIPHSFCSIKDKGAKSIIEIREVKSEAYEMY